MSEFVIRPGLLVLLSSEVGGNVRYRKEQLEYAHRIDGGAEQSRWETTRTVIDPEEFAEASKIRDKCRSLVRGACSPMYTPTGKQAGLLCPEDRKDDLVERIDEARELAADFNRSATYTHVSFEVFWGVVAQDDERAARAIAAQVRALMDEIQAGLAELDAKKVRAVCNKAVSLGKTLTDERRASVDIAVRAARQACKRIVKAGEQVSIEIDRNAIRAVGLARTSFLDVENDDDGELATVTPMSRAVDIA